MMMKDIFSEIIRIHFFLNMASTIRRGGRLVGIGEQQRRQGIGAIFNLQ
jgi:hypothetical protein